MLSFFEHVLYVNQINLTVLNKSSIFTDDNIWNCLVIVSRHFLKFEPFVIESAVFHRLPKKNDSGDVWKSFYCFSSVETTIRFFLSARFSFDQKIIPTVTWHTWFINLWLLILFFYSWGIIVLIRIFCIRYFIYEIWYKYSFMYLDNFNEL